MRRERNPNLQILEMVVDRLGPLADVCSLPRYTDL